VVLSATCPVVDIFLVLGIGTMRNGYGPVDLNDSDITQNDVLLKRSCKGIERRLEGGLTCKLFLYMNHRSITGPLGFCTSMSVNPAPPS
jgi:hypothetical protein